MEFKQIPFGKYLSIFVSGPQRSGTRYTAQTIADSLKDYRCIQTGTTQHDEFDWPYYGETPREIRLASRGISIHPNKDNKVIQCPNVSHKLHKLKDAKDFVIWMVRNEEDVNASEERINWLQSSHDPPRNRFEEEEKPKYLDMFPEYEEKIKRFKRNYTMKTWMWNNVQKPLMKVDYLELPFETLRQTDGYLPKEKRKGFTKDQIRWKNWDEDIPKIVG